MSTVHVTTVFLSLEVEGRSVSGADSSEASPLSTKESSELADVPCVEVGGERLTSPGK